MLGEKIGEYRARLLAAGVAEPWRPKMETFQANGSLLGMI
jgi:hypothetical protein